MNETMNFDFWQIFSNQIKQLVFNNNLLPKYKQDDYSCNNEQS